MSCCDECEEVKEFEAKFDEGVPYEEYKTGANTIIRKFSSDINPHWLKWHWDEEYRKIEVIEGVGWQFQFDDELPTILKPGGKLGIPAGVYHRLIKGATDLVIRIEKVIN